jgi:ketosteroid isomerase-like protein
MPQKAPECPICSVRIHSRISSPQIRCYKPLQLFKSYSVRAGLFPSPSSRRETNPENPPQPRYAKRHSSIFASESTGERVLFPSVGRRAIAQKRLIAGDVMDMKATVLEFVERINAHDVEGILDLMAEDYRFINSAGDTFRGKTFMRATWRAHFVQYPDFQIRAQRVLADDEAVGIFGWAQGTYTRDGQILEENHWEVPAAFLGIAQDGKMTHWQVFSDTTMVFDLIKANE